MNDRNRASYEVSYEVFFSTENTIKPFAIPKISKKNLFVDFAFPIFIALSKCKDKSCFVALVLTSTIQNKQRINKS